MFPQFGEAANYQELLRWRRCVDFFVFEDPGVSVGDKYGVQFADMVKRIQAVQ